MNTINPLNTWWIILDRLSSIDILVCKDKHTLVELSNGDKIKVQGVGYV